MLSQFEATYDTIVQATHLSGLAALLREIRDNYGLAHVVYHAVHLPYSPTPNPIVLPTYEPEWVQLYTDRDYFRIDPVVASGRNGFLPLDWDAVDHESSQAQRFFKEAERFGVGRHGMTIPVRGPGGERAILSITSNASSSDWQQTRLAYMREFQLIAHVLHDQAVRIAGLRFPSIKRQLSSRESETLQLAASGFAPKRIAAKLCVSPTAVRLYLQSARSKLDCMTLNQAIARAISLELIEA